jgi:hypothetical protein
MNTGDGDEGKRMERRKVGGKEREGEEREQNKIRQSATTAEGANGQQRSAG